MALGMVLIIKMDLADYHNALAAPELAVHFNWPNLIKVNDAFCLKNFFMALTAEEDVLPNWSVLGIKKPIFWNKVLGKIENLNETGLSNEGCIRMNPNSSSGSWS
mgnify:CR=1 FL=1